MATFGYSNIGISEDFVATADVIAATKATAPENGTITSFSAYTKRIVTNHVAKVGLYDSAFNFLGASDEVTISNTVADWKTFPVSSTLNIVGGQDYYLAFYTDSNGVNSSSRFSDDSFPTPGTNLAFYQNDGLTYSTFPDPITLNQVDPGYDTAYSIYATYTPAPTDGFSIALV